jgi:hypothetical protein
VVAVIVLAVAAASPALASKAIAEAEDLVCTSCHDKPGSKLLTDRGKYYEHMGSLDGFDDLSAEVGRCTHCHQRKPGSEKLTPAGRRYRWLFGDMKGIRDILMGDHPPPAGQVEDKPEG